MTTNKIIKIGYSINRKKFIVKVSPADEQIAKVIKFLGRSNISYDDKADLWEVNVSMINAIKLSTNLANIAKVRGFEVLITRTFEVKKELLESNIKSGKNRLGKRSKYEVKLVDKAIPKHLNKVLMPFQKEGVKTIIRKNGRLLLADDMGLGKTIQALTFIAMYKSIRRILIVCPKTIKHVWDRECDKWGITDVRFIIDGPPDAYDLSNGFGGTRITIINYEMVHKWKQVLIDWNPDMIVCDEIHYIKNRKATRTLATEAVGHKAKFVLGLTGTPVANSPMELFTISNMIRPKMFDYTNFNYRFCGGEAMQCRTAHNAQELHEIMSSTIMLRRLKEDVLTELPPKRSIQVELEIDMKNYDKILDAWAEENDMEATSMSYKAKLREVIAHDKIPALLEWTDKFLEDTGRKLIIFAHHRIIRDMLWQHYEGKAVKIEGGMKDVDRKESEERFQNDDSVRVFIGSITACAEGITLTAASDVCMAEMIFNPKKMEQAEDRAHRKGQNNHVTIWNLVCTGTYETDMLEILDEKRIMAAQVVDGKSSEQAEMSVEKELTYRLLDMVANRKYK